MMDEVLSPAMVGLLPRPAWLSSLLATANVPEGAVLGQVWRQHTHFFYVRVADADTDALIETQAKANIKKEGQRIYVGDWVWMDQWDTANATGRIVQVLPRQQLLEKTRVANVGGCLVVAPLQQPELELAHVQRLLVLARLSGLQPTVVFTKADLATPEALNHLETTRQALQAFAGVESIVLGLHTPEATLQAWADAWQAQHPLWVLAGVSGAGKSTLINRLNPSVKLKTAEVSAKLERGRHTTRHSELIRIRQQLFLADCPGFSQLQLPAIEPQAILPAFPELMTLTAGCGLGLACTHLHEPDCAVKPALMEASPHTAWLQLTYEVYLELRQQLEEAWQILKQRSQKTTDAEGSTKQLAGGKGEQAKSVIRLNARHRERNRKTEKQRLRTHLPTEEEDD
ncbi:MAG: ribosome small subunit-dependent GTPase A [Vampirovibrionales bacterium]